MWLLGLIRRIVYKTGFRPKYRAMLFSPSLDMKYAVKDTWKYFLDGFELANSQPSTFVRCRECGDEWIRDGDRWIRNTKPCRHA